VHEMQIGRQPRWLEHGHQLPRTHIRLGLPRRQPRDADPAQAQQPLIVVESHQEFHKILLSLVVDHYHKQLY